MATGEKRGKKRNFSDTEIETLVGELEARKTVLFGGHSSGVTNKKKQFLPVSEAVGEQEGFSDADAQRPAQSSAPSASKSGRVLTDAVLQLQQETINAVNRVADELRQMREVMQEIAQSLKDAVKT
ncbi:myb-related transcription factor, partner of profilin-like [Tachysurus ichikawai]